MSKEELRTLIESLGFRLKEGYDYTYLYKEFELYLDDDFYDFWNGDDWFHDNSLNDLKPLEESLKNEIRSIKLKRILG